MIGSSISLPITMWSSGGMTRRSGPPARFTRSEGPRFWLSKRQFFWMDLAVLGEHLDERGADDEAIGDFADHLDLLFS